MPIPAPGLDFLGICWKTLWRRSRMHQDASGCPDPGVYVVEQDRSQGSFGSRKRWVAPALVAGVVVVTRDGGNDQDQGVIFYRVNFRQCLKNHLNRVVFFLIPWVPCSLVRSRNLGQHSSMVYSWGNNIGKWLSFPWAGASCRSCHHVSEDWLGANACGKTQGWVSGSCYAMVHTLW